MSTNNIGLPAQKSQELADKLQTLLANYSVYYQNVRGYHWNIKGNQFFELHVKFEELYNDLLLKIDEVAERILTLNGTPKPQFSDYLKNSSIKETNFSGDSKQAIQEILASFKTLIEMQREILAFASDLDDEGTNSLMSDYIREQEKLVWMYNAYLG